MARSEATIHSLVCHFLRLQYPQALFHTDFAAGIKMTIGQAGKYKQLQSGRGWPDLFIANPIGSYKGLFIELKRDGECVYLKNGKLSSTEHIQEQAAVLRKLALFGYYATFVIGLDEAIETIKWYFGGANDHEKFTRKTILEFTNETTISEEDQDDSIF